MRTFALNVEELIMRLAKVPYLNPSAATASTVDWICSKRAVAHISRRLWPRGQAAPARAASILN